MAKKIPDSIIIVSVILLLFIGLTWLIPAGEFERKEVNHREVVIPGSFHDTDPAPQNLWSFFTAPIKGFEAAADIIAFVFLVGGAFSIVTKTGAIDAGLQKVVNYAVKHPQLKGWIIALLMSFFSFAGCTFGMAEEVLVFMLITLPLAYALGYDAIVGTAIPFIGAGVGFAGAMFNPFTVGIAQGIAELTPFSGWEYRTVVWITFTLIGILFVYLYARRISKDPTKSLLHGITSKKDYQFADQESLEFNTPRIIILILFIATLGLLIYGVNVWEWYITEISGLFVALGIAAAFIYRLKPNDAVKVFSDGAKEMMVPALLIGLARGILVVASDGKIIDPILNGVAGLAEGLPQAVSVQMMFLTQCFINFFIPSGSGQAALTMPVMTPLSDILGISRQTAVLAYQFGDGLSNLIIPTSGVTMGILAIAKIPYNIWIKWIWKFMLLWAVIAMILLAIPTSLFTWS